MTNNNKKYLVVIAGPTAVGKTALSIRLAKHFDAEIVSADSRQFFTELKIGTAKPSLEELNEVKHHFIDNLSIKEDYDAGRYAEECENLLQQEFQKRDMMFLVGGSGMYIDGVTRGFDQMPAIPQNIRSELNEEVANGKIPDLLLELESKDPSYFDIVDRKNTHRIIRALEVIRHTKRPFSEFRKGISGSNPKNYRIIKIALEMNREDLYQRIDKRMDDMIAAGLIDEAKSLYDLRDKQALQTVGYKEVFGYLNDEYDKEEAIRLLKRNSRRYAKRQLTWFRKDKDYHWFHPMDENSIIECIYQQKNA